MCLFLERERDLWPRGQSGAALGAYVRDLGPQVGDLGPLLGPMLAVLAALGASVGGPEPSCAAKSRSS